MLHNYVLDFFNVTKGSFYQSFIESIIIVSSVLLIFFLVRGTLLKILKMLIKRSNNIYLVSLSKNRVLRSILYLLPIIVLYNFKNYFLNDDYVYVYEKTVFVLLLFFSILFCFYFLDGFVEITKNSKLNEKLPIKPISQILKILIFCVSIIILIAHFLDKSPIYLLSGIGAVSAIIMFIFKESIQSFIAAIQITLYKSVKIGDWIEVPKYNVDGEVKDINLNIISIKNWDNTTTIIPTYCLMTESYKNWTSMFSSGRRIKRSIFIDVNTINHLSNEDIEKLKKVKIINDYLNEKEKHVQEANKTLQADELLALNGKKLTNIGTFRKYVEYYLKHHPDINQQQLLIVRQLENQYQGIPIEIYCFSKKTTFTEFEGVQSDIFDHLYSIVPLFGLKVYQQPGSGDFKEIKFIRQE